jgi:stage II sporulation protein D
LKKNTVTSFSRSSFVKLTAVVMVAVGSLSIHQLSADAAVPKLDAIRVALFIDTAKYSLVEPVVTLSSVSGLDIGIRNANAVKTWISLPNNTTIRSSLDQFSVKILETTDFTAAKTLQGKLASLQGDSYILSVTKQGKQFYQVFYGSYDSLAAAAAGQDQAMKDPGVADLAQGAIPVITGPMHWNAGSYATEAEAASKVGVLSQAGFTANLVIQEDVTGKLIYSAWVGSEASQAQLDLVKQQAATVVPDLQLQPTNAASAYLLKRADVTADISGTVAVAHYAVGGQGTKAWVHPKENGIVVKERSDRSYRGDMELSAFNGKLALINELPTEQYLYSVVSTEMGMGWPAEALKAQAVAARTFALKQGLKYQIAQVVDTTLDQAYFGIQKEFDAAVQAVNTTAGEVLTDSKGLIEPVFSSNAGGMTADPSEVWGNPAAYLHSVVSPDEGAAAGKVNWYQITLADGKTGYVRSDYLKDTGQKNAAGANYYEATEENVNVRSAPYVDNAANSAIAQLANKEKVVVTGQQAESNAYSWVRGPYDAAFLESKLSASGVNLEGGLKTLEISKKGPSGRAIELKANGQIVKVPYPDAFRTLLGGLPSTRFEIQETGGYTIGNSGTGAQAGSAAAGSVYVLSGKQSASVVLDKSQVSVIGGSGEVKPWPSESQATPTGTQVDSASKQYIFKGTGFGHGLGMSQWGARGYAELGYDYRKILQTYYYGVNITKE